MSAIATVVSFVGLAVAVGSLFLIAHVSGLGGGAADVQLLGVAIVGFLFGVFLFGWGLGKRTQY